MKIPSRKAGFVILVILISVLTFTSRSQTQTKDENIVRGINYIYHIQFDSAEVVFNEIVSANPTDPAGYFFLAMIDWWKINLNKESDSLDETFFKKADKVEEIAEEKLNENEFDDEAMFYKGGALGYRGLVRSLRESWLKAAEDGKEALNLLQRAYEINGNNKDVIFGIGMYNYFAEYVPDAYPVVKPLMLIFPKGDKIKGLSQIKESANNSRFTRTEAKYVLAYLNLVYEKNYTEAELYSGILNKEFPENPVFEKYLYNSYVGLSKWDQAMAGWSRVIEKIDSSYPGYNNPNLKREANYYMAVCMSKIGKLLEAEPFIQTAETITRQIDKDNESAYTAFIYLLAGMYNDLKQNKATAVVYYDKVLAMKNFQNSHLEAEKFKKEGYK